MAEGVIIDLKLVDVKHTQGDGLLEADGLLPLVVAVQVVAAPVGHPCHGVHHRLLFHLGAVAVELDMGVYPGPDDGGMVGLGDIVHRPQHQASLLILRVPQAGNENHRHVLGDDLLLHLPQQIKAVHTWHDYVQQHQRKILHTGMVQPRLGGVDHRNVVILLQNGAQHIGLDRAVVNNQNLLPVFHISTPNKKLSAPPRSSGRTVHFLL